MPLTERELHICPDAVALADEMAAEFGRLAMASVATSGRFTVALAGGSIPKAAYALLAREPYSSSLPWAHIHVFWGDERHVPPDHPDSNYRMAYEALLSKVAIPSDNIHRICAENPAPEAARSYAGRIRTAQPRATTRVAPT